MLNIAAFTFKYDHIEDRILMVGNLSNDLQRVDFWLTRKLVLRLLSAAAGLIEKTSSDIAGAPVQLKSDLAQFHHDSARQGLQVDRESEDLLAEDPSLLCRLDVSHQAGRYRILFFIGDEEPFAASVLTYDELHQMLYLIHRGSLALDWGVDNQLFTPDVSTSSITLQ
ncbi:hypothetical protein [Neptuniibacter sp. 1_MG-2023]|jgi:hypothetical protein|uniref:hypothetical protein n=1 Tax=Neptuniibacter sp. 1_MG-2023 TaxID=3062662 RepID=UPI0026E24423|nr:hypothetical protein [Neptuniibacter sp. 1_MG-2023]MDO6595113.1 hypothetical protein [Neptuniibacter sp. 1_MG-2023]